MLEQAIKVAAISQLRQLTYRPSVSAPEVSASAVLRNPVRQRGQAFQNKAKLLSRPTYSKKPRPLRHNENQIHDLIIDHPFLLFTPRLFEGGLFLDSIISKLPIQHRNAMGKDERRVPDFVYLTISGEAIKITLVEIESSAHQLFTRKGGGVTLHSDAQTGLNQVREWRQWMQDPMAKARLLQSMQPLLSRYPYPLLDDEGGISSYICLEVDYFLVVGADQPTTPAEKAVLDHIYREEDIVVMSYPMMIEAVGAQQRARNLLKKQGPNFDVEHVWEPDQLLSFAPCVRVPEDQGHLEVVQDGEGIQRILALGHPYGYRRRPERLPHPSARLALSLRSEGRCEHPGCNTPIINSQGFHGANLSWCNHEHMRTEDISDQANQVMLCHQHAGEQSGKVLYLRQFDEEWEALVSRKGRYDWQIDVASQRTSVSLLERNVTACINELRRLLPWTKSDVWEDMRSALMKTSALPLHAGFLLGDLAFFPSPEQRIVVRFPQSKLRVELFDVLVRVGALEIEAQEGNEYRCMQSVFSERLANWLIETFPSNYPRLFSLVCEHRLLFLLARVRREIEQMIPGNGMT